MKPLNNTQISIENIGEPIGLEKGKQFINNIYKSDICDINSYLIGKNILEKILSQPKCVGIKFYEALNELNQKTLVFLGIDSEGYEIVKYTLINEAGKFITEQAIVADRIKTIPINDDQEWWNID